MSKVILKSKALSKSKGLIFKVQSTFKIQSTFAFGFQSLFWSTFLTGSSDTPHSQSLLLKNTPFCQSNPQSMQGMSLKVFSREALTDELMVAVTRSENMARLLPLHKYLNPFMKKKFYRHNFPL
jgi:hypothetical protein